MKHQKKTDSRSVTASTTVAASTPEEESVTLNQEQLANVRMLYAQLRASRAELALAQQNEKLAEREANTYFAKIDAAARADGAFELVGSLDLSTGVQKRKRLVPPSEK